MAKLLDRVNESICWNGVYKTIQWEIKCNKNKGFDFSENLTKRKDAWVFYLYLSPDRFPEESKHLCKQLWLKPKKNVPEWSRYDYMNSQLLNEIEFHGGCTYYHKEAGIDGEMKYVKVGCDYQHFFDQGHDYNFNSIYYDVQTCIDSFLAIVPNYLRWCSIAGGYWSPSEGITSHDGLDFISHKGIAYEAKEYPDAKRWYKEIIKEQTDEALRN